MDIYEKIKERRLALGMTQDELAKKLGYTGKSMICRVEAKEIDLPTSKLMEIAVALNTPVSYLIGENEAQLLLSKKEQVMLSFFNDLNDAGKDKLIDYAFDLAEMDKYKNG